MKLKEQFKISWSFCVAGVMLILLLVLSASNIITVTDFFFGITYILLAGTLTYTCLKTGRKLQEERKYWKSILMVYGGGILSGLWLYKAIEYFFS